MMISIAVPWVMFGAIAGVITMFEFGDTREWSDDARAVWVFSVVALFPLLLALSALACVLYLLPRTLYRGVRDLRRSFWPADHEHDTRCIAVDCRRGELPKARVHNG